MSQILEIRDVAKSFGSLRALDGVTLDVEERKVSILIGPNGSRKTTLINVISGFYAPDSGTIRLGKKDITGLPPYELYSLGLVRTFQIPNLFWRLTVLENLLVAEKRNPGESFAKAFDIVGLKSWQNFFRPWRDTSSGWILITGLESVKAKFRAKKPAKMLDPR